MKGLTLKTALLIGIMVQTSCATTGSLMRLISAEIKPEEPQGLVFINQLRDILKQEKQHINWLYVVGQIEPNEMQKDALQQLIKQNGELVLNIGPATAKSPLESAQLAHLRTQFLSKIFTQYAIKTTLNYKPELKPDSVNIEWIEVSLDHA